MTALLVADSFRVRVDDAGIAEARLFRAHLERFALGVGEMLDTIDAPEDWWELEFTPFLENAPQEIADGGAGFPRIELLADADGGALQVNVRHRPLPQLTRTLSLRTAPGYQPTFPGIKGPNIAQFASLMHELGGEALLVDDSGSIVEGSTTSIVWWEGDTLCTVASTARVPSITESIVLSLAEQAGYAIEWRQIDVATLSCKPAWALNALHGIRRITHIDGHELRPTPDARLTRLRDGLEETWQPLTSEPA